MNCPEKQPQRFLPPIWAKKIPLGGDDPRAGLTAAVVWHLIEIRVLTFAIGD